MTESEHEVKARDFVDGILQINRDHGVETAPAAIEYDIAVAAAVKTFRYLRENATDSSAAESA